MERLLVIFGATYLIFIIAIIVLIYFLRQPRAKQKELVIFSLVTLPLIYLTSLIAGWLYYNPRPFMMGHFVPIVPHKDTNGFPSDHTLASVAMAVVVWRSNRRLGLILLALAVLVGISRVLAGVHHAVDIVASFIIAIVVGWLSHRFIFDKLRRTNKPITSAKGGSASG